MTKQLEVIFHSNVIIISKWRRNSRETKLEEASLFVDGVNVCSNSEQPNFQGNCYDQNVLLKDD
jgi:hypothetical protein